MGHSLGAHVMGRAARTIYKENGGALKVARITGMDPAGPGFKDPISSGKANGRLRKSDADFVVIIHTNGLQGYSSAWRGAFGFGRHIGHVDFFANGGVKQPGCSNLMNPIWLQVGACAHCRVTKLMVESIVDHHAFPAYKCYMDHKRWRT